MAETAIGVTLGAGVAALAGYRGTPRLDAELLLCSALGVDRAQLVIDRDEPVGGAAG